MKRIHMILLLVAFYVFSVGLAYEYGRMDHGVSAQRFVRLAETEHATLYAAGVIGTDWERAYLVYYSNLFWPVRRVFSAELAALPPEFRAKYPELTRFSEK